MRTPLLLIDGDCGFCQASAAWLHRHFPGGWEYEANQRVNLPDVGITAAQASAQVWFVVEGAAGWERFGGAQAVAKLLLMQPKRLIKPFAKLAFVPGFREIAQCVYRFVARHRSRLPGATENCQV